MGGTRRGAEADDAIERKDAAIDRMGSTGRDEVRGADLEPIDVVERELTRPDGTKVVVQVPVYPPFRLPDQPSGRKASRGRSAPSLKRKRTQVERPSGTGSAEKTRKTGA